MPSRPNVSLVAGDPPLAVWDEPEPCPYLPDRAARLRVALPLEPVSPQAYAEALARGERRLGRVIYRPKCTGCQECVPMRVRAADFQPDRSQQRAWQRGQSEFRIELGPIEATAEKCALHDRHLRMRGMDRHGDTLSVVEYLDHFGSPTVVSLEIRYRVGETLAAVAIVDVAADAWSAVYTFWEPDLAHLSPGVFSVLTQIDLCRRSDIPWLYLGFWVAGCRHMCYKARYRPHEIRVDGIWTPVPDR